MDIQREQLFRFFFLGVFLFLLIQLLKILSPFYTGILGAIVLTLIFYPMHRLILNQVGHRRSNLAATLSTTLVIVLIVFPFILFSWLLLNELDSLSSLIKQVGTTLEKIKQGETFRWLGDLQERFKGIVDFSEVNFKKMATQISSAIIKFIVSFGKHIPKNALAFIMNLTGMIFTMFFLFRDGLYILKRAKELVPMERRYKDQIANQLYLTVTAVVRGVFLVAAAQGLTAGIGYLIAQVPSSLLLGFATMFTAMIPFVGAGVVWLPVGLYYFVQGVAWKGIFLLVWGFFVVSTVDNFLRPVIIGNRAKLPMLVLFFGILGGLKMYGPMGIFLGPLVVALVLAFIRIYREVYRLGRNI